MKKPLVLMTWMVIASLTTSCATYSGWQPTIDPRGSTVEARSRDLTECKQLAKKASGEPAHKAGVGTLVGAVAGAIGGVIIGAAAGAPGTGAAVGTAVGGLGGGAQQGLSADKEYKEVYSKCLEGRGHRVLN